MVRLAVDTGGGQFLLGPRSTPWPRACGSDRGAFAMSSDPPARSEFDAVVIGAGFSGLYMVHRLRNQMDLSVRAYDTAAGVGGTWYWNRYPGARCDSESHVYCYSFDEDLLQEWNWSERYPEQHEILGYLEHVCERFDLAGSIRFQTRVTAARWNETSATWSILTDQGETVNARYLIAAVGVLSDANVPRFPGAESFGGV